MENSGNVPEFIGDVGVVVRELDRSLQERPTPTGEPSISRASDGESQS